MAPLWLLSSCLLASIGAAVAQMPAPTLLARQGTTLPQLVFNSIDNSTVCGSQLISWLYSGPSDRFSLSVTNDGVNQQQPTTTLRPQTLIASEGNGQIQGRNVNPLTITAQLSTSFDPTNKSFLWQKINVPQGWYILMVTSPDNSTAISRSNPFFIRDIGDTCGIVSPTQTSATSSITSSPSSSSPTFTPSGAMLRTVNTRVVAGGIVGGVALICILLFFAYFFVHRRRRNRPTERSGPGLAAKSHVGWSGLRSVESRASMLPPLVRLANSGLQKSSSNARHTSRTESLATFVDPTGAPETKYGSPSQDEIEAYINGSLSRRGSAVQNAWHGGSHSEEKFGGSVDEMELSGVQRLSYNNGSSEHVKQGFKRRSQSISTFGSEIVVPPQRRPSVSSHPPLPTGEISIDSTTSSIASPNNSSFPPTSLPSTQQKKPLRKPAPVYNPSFDGGAPTQSSPDLASPLTTLSATPPFGFAHSPSVTAAGSHYNTRANIRHSSGLVERDDKQSKSKTRIGSGPSRESVVDPPGEKDIEPGLMHKSSFGPGGIEGKPLHYLVPDILPQGKR